MRVLVLGAAGFIGGHIARVASQQGMEVHGLRRRPNSGGVISDVPVRWHQGDLRDGPSLIEAMRGCEVVFHAAGYYPLYRDSLRGALQEATLSMRAVFDAAREVGVRRVIYTSSITTVGKPPEGEDRLADERDFYVPGSAPSTYFEAKWLMECESLRASRDNLEVITLIPTTVFGPGDVKPTTGEILQRVAKRQLLIGIRLRANIIDGRDVATAHIAAAAAGEPGKRYILGGENHAIDQVLHAAAQIAGVPPPRWNLSTQAAARLFRMVRAVGYPVPSLLMGIESTHAVNGALGQRVFGFTPRPLEETLQDTITWFREHGYV